MKISRLILSVVMIFVVVAGWFSLMSNSAAESAAFDSYVKTAKEYDSKKLYQKSIASYAEALKIKENDKIREQWIKDYELGYADGVITRNQYGGALETMCSIYPKKAQYWEKLILLYFETNSHNKAFEYCKKSVKEGAKSDNLEKIKTDVLYSIKRRGKGYVEYNYSPTGLMSVKSRLGWVILSTKSFATSNTTYEYMSPISDSGLELRKLENSTRVFDSKGVVQAILDIKYEETKGPSENMLPVMQSGKWKYYNYDSMKYVLDEYDDVSNFKGNCAAVKKGNAWTLIDNTGKAVSKTNFDDIKIYKNGEYNYGGIMVASENKKYGIYDKTGKKQADFAAEDMDAYYGDLIAFKQDGKWGFVDSKGNVKIKPKYENAKSFSNGLAAVSVNGKWGFINRDDKLVIAADYVDADYFDKNGVCFVKEISTQYTCLSRRFPYDGFD